MNLRRPAAVLGTLTAALLTGGLIGAGPAAADGLPFSDPTAQGYLGFCDASGRQVTSGSLTTKPFAVRAVSSVPAPAGYGAKDGGKATLYGYQPREGVDPAEWSGQQLGSSSSFTNDAHPMSKQTILDYSMADFTSIYAARWDGLIQLRLFFGAPNRPPLTRPYPATVIRIDGDRWSVAGDAGQVDCAVGSATSAQEVLLQPSVFASASAAARSSAAAAASSGAAARPAPTPGASGTPAPGASSGDAGGVVDTVAPAGAASGGADGGSSGAAAAVVAGLAAAGALGGGVWWRRRRA